jgi:hypothetical protein
MPKDPDDMTDSEIHGRIRKLAFSNDERLLQTFTEILRSGLPPGTGVALRGSVVTDERYEDSRPFDADGPGTSDLDVTLIGNEVMDCWEKDAFYIPGLHTKPLGDKDPGCAPRLDSLRRELQALVHRPVNFQATANIILYARDVLFDQPYYMLIEPEEKSDSKTADV